VQRIFRAHRGTDHDPHDAYAADALAGFVLGDTTTATDVAPGTKGADATVHILIDHGALVRGGAVDGEACEIPGVGPVDVGWVRQLLGSAFLTAVIKKGRDIRTVAHLGRHVPAEVMTALTVSGRECDVDGCHQRGYLERDHVHDHARGGPTSFANLGWLCYRHHRKKSAGWRLGVRDPATGKRPLRPPTERAA
jgi:HNH endonuclease